MGALETLRALSDQQVTESLDELTRLDRKTAAAIVAHLVVVKERSIHLDQGYSSLVEYCTERLGCSLDVAYKRSAAVKVAQAQPEVLAWLEAGDTTMSALAVLAPHADDRDLVAECRGKTKRQTQELVANRWSEESWNRFQTSSFRPTAAAAPRPRSSRSTTSCPAPKVATTSKFASYVDPITNTQRCSSSASHTWTLPKRVRACCATCKAPFATSASIEARRGERLSEPSTSEARKRRSSSCYAGHFSSRPDPVQRPRAYSKYAPFDAQRSALLAQDERQEHPVQPEEPAARRASRRARTDN